MTDESEFNGAEDEALQALIGKQLKNMYDSVLSEPIPDRLMELLGKLDQIALPDTGGTDEEADSR